MSINRKIIEAVRENPFINTSSCLQERNRFWKSQAEKLGTTENFLKTRWHLLTNRYKRALQDKTHFQYADALKNITSLEECNTRGITEETMNEIQHEFVITKKDIEIESDAEDYVFIEVVALEGGVEEDTIEMDVAAETKEQDPKYIEVSEQKPSVVQLIKERQETVLKTSRDMITEQEVEGTLTQHTSTTTRVNNVHSKNNDGGGSSSSSSNSSEIYCKQERCEDIIFGELIVAMLKSMPPEKKRKVKKEIMNLLFT